MKTLGARLALSYSLVSTATMIMLLAVGFFLLSRHLTRSADLLNAAECQRIEAGLGSDLAKLPPAAWSKKAAAIAASSASAFFEEISTSDGGTAYRSANLRGQSLPKGKPGRAFSVTQPELGELRVKSATVDSGEITVATSMALAHQVTDGFAQISVILVCLTLLASLAAGLGLSHFALRPVRVIQDTAHRIGSDNLGERIPVPDVEDEISDLARLLNDMFDRLESSFEQIRRFTAEASHELKTPLSLIRLHAEKLLADGGLSSGQEDALQSQLEEIARLHQIIEELLFLSKAEAGVITPQAASENPRACLEAFTADAVILTEHAGVRFFASIEGDQTVSFDRKWIRQVLLNLVVNALNVSPPGGVVTLRSGFTIDHWRLEVEDEGPGVPTEERDTIFERFVRLKSTKAEAPKGNGLGLAICRSMIEMQGGRIRAQEGARKAGLCVVCELPLPPSPKHEKPADTARKSPAGPNIVPD